MRCDLTYDLAAGRYTIPGLSAYSVSKHATISFSDALRREMAKFNITVHTVEPSTYRYVHSGPRRSAGSVLILVYFTVTYTSCMYLVTVRNSLHLSLRASSMILQGYRDSKLLGRL